jgi:hypothetical protein
MARNLTSGAVTVEEVQRGKGLLRFTELPAELHGTDPRFAPPVPAWERYRTSRRNEVLSTAEVGLFLARRGGPPAGRVAVHCEADGGEGRLGFWSTIDDPAVAGALVRAAGEWLDEHGCPTLAGPWSFDADAEPGLLVEGHGAPGTTGRPWVPEWEPRLLLAALPVGEVVEEVGMWRHDLAAPPPALAAVLDGPAPPVLEGRDPTQLPGQAGRYLDRRIVLERVAGVPDVSGPLRASGVAGAWGLAKRARDADWDGCTVVRWTGEPAEVVPGLLRAAAASGYAWALAPWTPDAAAPPETVHRRYRWPR